jgi:hypothetical protein
MKKINNIHDLLAEKQRLTQKLDLLKRDMSSEVSEIKEKIQPILKVVAFLSGGAAAAAVNGTPKRSLLKAGANLGVDLLVGSKLKRAGWLAKMLLPPLLRGISSTVIDKFKK